MRKSNNFSSSSISALIAAALFVSLTLVSCDRQPYPMGMVDENKNSPAYTVGADINHSPAVTPAN